MPNQRGSTQLLQGLLWFAEKTIEQSTQQWTLAPKTIELRDTERSDEIWGCKGLRGICNQLCHRSRKINM